MSEKPLLFLSHAAQDGDLATFLKNQIEFYFFYELNVFCSSSPISINIGTEWMPEIILNLDKSIALIVLLTERSIWRHWVWFEIGYYWNKYETQKGRIYTLNMLDSGIPQPLSNIEAKSLFELDNVLNFLYELDQLFKLNTNTTAIRKLKERPFDTITHAQVIVEECQRYKDTLSSNSIQRRLAKYLKNLTISKS